MKSLKHIDFYYVDDDLLYLSYFRKQFQFNISHSLFTFSSGEAFLNKFARDNINRSYKIIILDYVLSSVDKKARTGLELVPVIKDIDPEAEVIILSGYENMDVKATSSTFHPAGFIKKNDHTFIKLYSTINLIVSKYKYKRKKSEGKKSVIVFLCIIGIFVLSILMLRIFWPHLLY